MPPIRTRPPHPITRTRRALHLEHVYDQYLHHNLERRERQHQTDLATDWEAPGIEDRGYQLFQHLHVRDLDRRELTLQRLEARNPAYHDAVQNYWDIMDSRDFFVDLTRILGDLRRRTRDRAQLHHLHMDHEFLRLLAIGLDTAVVDINMGVGTPEDPVDLDLYLTASEDDSASAAEAGPPPLEERLTDPPAPLASRLSSPSAPASPPHRRRPLNSDGSEVDSAGQVFHARDGRPCHSMWAHGPDYSTDEVLERDIHEEERIADMHLNDLRTREAFRAVAASGGYPDFDPAFDPVS